MTKTDVIEGIQRALLAKKATLSCSACGQGAGWTALEARDLKGVAGLGIFSTSGDFSIPMPYIPVIVLICNNCGYIRLHSKPAVENFLAGSNAPISKPADDEAAPVGAETKGGGSNGG